jgi:hypothetical protein
MIQREEQAGWGLPHPDASPRFLTNVNVSFRKNLQSGRAVGRVQVTPARLLQGLYRRG